MVRQCSVGHPVDGKREVEGRERGCETAVVRRGLDGRKTAFRLEWSGILAYRGTSDRQERAEVNHPACIQDATASL